MKPPEISVVIGSFNRKKFFRLVIERVREELACIAHEIIVVDGGSTDGTLQWLLQQKDIITIIQHNRGTWRGKQIERRSWGYFMNLGFKSAQGKYICMLSDDSVIVPNAILHGYKLFEEKLSQKISVGAVAFYWRNYPEQKEYVVGLTLGNKMFVNHGIYLRSALETVNFIDETSYRFYCADGDLCLKLWSQGFSCIDSPGSYVEHYSHTTPEIRSSNSNTRDEDWQKYLNKWKNIFYDEMTFITGGWIEKEYDDPSKTANCFKVDIFWLNLKKWFVQDLIKGFLKKF